MKKKSTKRPKRQLTGQQAIQFERFSLTNAALIQAALTCDCQPYVDTFTYERWKAQGMQVQRGQKGIKIGVLREVPDRDDPEKNEAHPLDGDCVLPVPGRPQPAGSANGRRRRGLTS